MIRPANPEKWLTFGGDPVPDTDSASLSTCCTILEYRILGDLFSISDTVTSRFYNTRRNDWRRQVMNPQHFESDLADIGIQITVSAPIVQPLQ